MNLTIELPDEIGAALKAQAQAKGVTPARYVSRMIEKTLIPDNSDEPFETGYGMWAKYGPAPSLEEIDQNRREMFRNFAQDLR